MNFLDGPAHLKIFWVHQDLSNAQKYSNAAHTVLFKNYLLLLIRGKI